MMDSLFPDIKPKPAKGRAKRIAFEDTDAIQKSKAQIGSEVDRIIDHWKCTIPNANTKGITKTTRNAIAGMLKYFEIEKCIEAISAYALWPALMKGSCNIKNKSWVSLYAFFHREDGNKLRVWIQKAFELNKEQEHNKIKNQSPSPAIRPLTNQMVNKLDPMQIKLKEEKEILDKLKESGRQVEVISRAINDIIATYSPNPMAQAKMWAMLKNNPDEVLRKYMQVRERVLNIQRSAAPPPAGTDATTPGA